MASSEISSSSSTVQIFPSNLRDLHHANEAIVCLVSLLVNPALVVLILTERNSVLATYSRVLLQNCVVDLVYTLACIASEMQIEFTQGYMVFTINSVFRGAPMSAHYVLIFVYAWLCSGAINIVPVMFYFRYTLICKGKLLSAMRLTAVTVLPLAASFMSACFLTYSLALNDPHRVELCARLLDKGIYRGDNSACMAASLTSPFFTLFIFQCLIMDSCVYIVMTYCCHAIYGHMHSGNVRYSPKTAQLQRQMNLMLLAQMCMPLFTAVIPVAILVFFPLLRVNIPGAGIAVTMAFAWVPIISPITTICLVSSFRHRLWNALAPKCVRKILGVEKVSSLNSTSRNFFDANMSKK